MSNRKFKELHKTCPHCQAEQHFMRKTCSSCGEVTFFREEYEEKQRAKLQKHFEKGKKQSLDKPNWDSAYTVKKSILRLMAQLEGKGTASVLLVIGKKPTYNLSYLTFNDIMRNIFKKPTSDPHKPEYSHHINIMMNYVRNEYISRVEEEKAANGEASEGETGNVTRSKTTKELVSSTEEENVVEPSDSSVTNGESTPVANASKKRKRSGTPRSKKKAAGKARNASSVVEKPDSHVDHDYSVNSTVTVSQSPELTGAQNETSHVLEPTDERTAAKSHYVPNRRTTKQKDKEASGVREATTSCSIRPVKSVERHFNTAVSLRSDAAVTLHDSEVNGSSVIESDEGGVYYVIVPPEEATVLGIKQERASEFVEHIQILEGEVENLGHDKAGNSMEYALVDQEAIYVEGENFFYGFTNVLSE